MISSYAAIDTMEMMWTEMFQEVGEEKMAPLGKAFIGTQESGLNRIYRHRPDLSYRPGSRKTWESESNFAVMYFSYPIYGMGKQFEELYLKWIDLHKSKNSDYSYDIFEVLVGEEGRKFQQEMFSLMRKGDVKHLWYRKDLSYIPGE